MLTNPDHEFVLRLLAGDADAFDALYRRYNRSLYANILKLTRDADAAQDILQEVFICLWEKRQTIDVNLPLANWLFTISYYKSVKHLKKILKEQVVRRNVEASAGNDETEKEWNDFKLEAIKNAIQQLSPQKQKVLIRCKLVGKSYKEVAEDLSISKHTVKEYLTLALASLRTILK